MQVSRSRRKSRQVAQPRLAMVRDHISNATIGDDRAREAITDAAPSDGEIAVIGLGYVGLPLALALARTHPARTVGFDIDAKRIDALLAAHDRTGETSATELQAAQEENRLIVTTDPKLLSGVDYLIVTVPTPVDRANRPDLGPLRAACETIGAALSNRAAGRPPPIVVFESTVYPGVTENICGPLIEAASRLRVGHDFFLGYSPERINPGDMVHTVDRTLKIVAGQTPEVAARIAALYGKVTGAGVFVARDIRTAEAAKVIENAQRDINIAFINEVTMIFGRLGLSVYDVLDAARTKWNFLDFRPGLVGGHCIGVDPFYLAACAKAAGHEPEIILAGRRINDGMGGYFADRIAEACKSEARCRPRTLVLGLAFKENLPDLRNSKVVDLVRALEARGHCVDVHDSHVDHAEAEAMYGITTLDALPTCTEEGGAYDCVVGAVPHKSYCALAAETLTALLKPEGLVADIKGLWRGLPLPAGLRRWQP
jgi:UDP-N-acetyl-D-glucosamine/UDP-N-acetyl-D-galactosamine dehydrogenase